MDGTQDTLPIAADAADSAKAGGPLRVVMLDLAAIIPYYTSHLCAALQRLEDIHVRLASVTYPHDTDCFRRLGVRNHPGVLDLTRLLRRFPAALRRTAKVPEYLVNLSAVLAHSLFWKPDVIHVQFLPLATRGLPVERWFLRTFRALGARVVYTVHNLLPQNSGQRYRATYQKLYSLADRLICHDAEAAGRLRREFSAPAQRISIIPHGLLFEPACSIPSEKAKARLGFQREECVVLWQGILRPYKGVGFLLEAWRQVQDAEPRARLALVGSGQADQVRSVREKVRALGLASSVRLELRFVSVEEMRDYYAAADLLVYPYSEATTSGALMTGLAYGKPIIATKLPSFESTLCDGKTALLVRYGDTEALAKSLLTLIRQEPLRRALGERLRQVRTTAPGWPEIARLTEECYRAAVGPAGAGRGRAPAV